MKAIFLLLILITITSCSTTMERDGGKVAQNESSIIFFSIHDRYFAEIEEEDEKYYLFIPELYIRHHEIKRYTGHDGFPVFTDTALKLNIKVYPERLYFSMGSYSTYIPYYRAENSIGDYYPLI